MKKFSLLIVVSLLSAVLFFSCKKDNPVPQVNPVPPLSIIGFWKGKYGIGPTTYPNLRYAFLFRNDGTVRVFDNTDTANASVAEGTYTLNGQVVTTNYVYLSNNAQYSTKSFVYPNFTFMEGTWGGGQNQVNGGKFFVNKY